MAERSIVFLATGRAAVLGAPELAAVADGTIVVGVGHFPTELDTIALAALSERTEDVGADNAQRTVTICTTGAESPSWTAPG